ncbi:hypothetical protein F0U62_02210 [Cystobacter fuscus]|uniref:hypothetical protein n=1 Tax=Cystobacter fuscus TaxID=43 RepID=UPI002B2B8205|nr:hypothetical protein F0U62_02210 [Cystobacter fuscus]
MKNEMVFSDAQQVIGRRWSEGQSQEQARILGLTRDTLDFISATGQWYSFQDFREGHGVQGSVTARDEGTPELRELLSKTERFFRSLLDDPASAGEQDAIRAILDALRFISSTCQYESLAGFLERVESNAPPLVVAAFETSAQAESWLRNHPSPPVFADVLIGDRYHDVAYDRESNFRRLPWNRDLERYLGWLEMNDPPVASASFATREEAQAWLRAQSHPPLRTWVLIAGEFHLAVYHPNVNHRALYPLSMALRDA